MAGHKLKRRGYIPAEPCYLIAILVTKHCVFPRIIDHKKRDHKNDHIRIGLQGFYEFR